MPHESRRILPAPLSWLLAAALIAACGGSSGSGSPDVAPDSDGDTGGDALPDEGGPDAETDAGSDVGDEPDGMLPDIAGDTGPRWEDLPETLPTGAEWLAHLEDELLPYWEMDAAYGTPEGNFPTFRCDDGSVYDAASNACPELANTAGWITSEFSRQYVRMMSRQTYFYGVAYHLTGDERLFELHQAGVDHIIANGLDPAGGAFTYFQNGSPGPSAGNRTSQDLAYAVVGLAMHYYLTRDSDTLAAIYGLRDYIFDEYWDDDLGMLRWTRDDVGTRELVGQLDQLNAYQLLLARVLPEADQAAWNADIERVVDVLMDDYFENVNDELPLFWGALPSQGVGSFHTDFGHTIKSFWMIYTAGRLLDEADWEGFAADHIPTVFELAYIDEAGDYQGGWAEKLSGQPNNHVWPGTEWWSYIELDQTAATLALQDPAPLGYLETTYPVYFGRMIDDVNGGVYHWVSGSGQVQFAKAHLWKNGYHEAEHTLVGYITSQALYGEDVELYFALADDAVTDVYVPYLYEGIVVSTSDESFEDTTGYGRTRVTFRAID